MTRYHAHLATEDRTRRRRVRRVRLVADAVCYLLTCAAIVAALYLAATRGGS